MNPLSMIVAWKYDECKGCALLLVDGRRVTGGFVHVKDSGLVGKEVGQREERKLVCKASGIPYIQRHNGGTMSRKQPLYEISRAHCSSVIMGGFVRLMGQ
jgi:hypothetical protein